MAPLSDEGRSLIGEALAEAMLLQMNRYAYENELIDKETYLKMTTQIKLGTDASRRNPDHSKPHIA